MPDFETILLEKRDAIARLTLNRPKVRNAVNAKMIEELGQAVAAVDADPDVRVLVVTGAGQAFQSGADIKELSTLAPMGAFTWIDGLASLTLALEALRQPVIAAINGHAYGGGLELALACDIRVAAASARMALPEVKIGVIPGAGGCERLPLCVGKGRAAEMILTGRAVDAKEALSMGLVNKVVPDGQAVDAAEDMARAIMANSPHAVGMAKQALANASGRDLAARIHDSARICALCFQGEESREGMAAFFEKRSPQFGGA
jgi:enoyl-CoA hydratase